MNRFLTLTIFASLVILLTACSFSLAGDITPPPGSELEPALQTTQTVSTSSIFPIVPPDLANGAVIYTRECASCHGTQGLGDGPQAAKLSVPAATLGLSDFARLKTPAEWYTLVTEGDQQGFMPAYNNLTDRQRWDVVAYAMSLSTTDGLIEQGKQLYQDNCSTCHGISGTGDGQHSGVLSTEPVDLTDQSLMAQNSADSLHQVIAAGVSPDMPAFAEDLQDNDIWALVAYIRSLTYSNTLARTEASVVTSVTPGSTPGVEPQASTEPAVSSTQVITSTSEITPTAPFTGTVSVQLINGSGGDAPSSAAVTLYGFDNMQVTYSDTLTTGADGLYTFKDVYVPEGRVFLTGVEYDSATYGSDITSIDPANPNLNLQITVYDSTTDTSALTADRVHIFFDFIDAQNVQVVEVFIISNSSMQAVVPPTKDGTVVTYPLPKGYSNLQFQDGELGGRYVEVAQGFADKRAVNPGVGEHTVIFAYQMPYNNKLDFVQSMFLPTNAVVVMVPEGGMKVDSDQLQDGGTRDFQGSTYHLYNGNGLIAGSSLEFTLSGKLQQAGASIFSGGTTQNLAIGLGVFGFVLVAVGLWLFRRNQLSVAAQQANISADFGALQEATPEDVDTLMDAIIALDDQYHAGNLPEDAYLKRRAALKDKLRELEQG